MSLDPCLLKDVHRSFPVSSPREGDGQREKRSFSVALTSSARFIEKMCIIKVCVLYMSSLLNQHIIIIKKVNDFEDIIHYVQYTVLVVG